MRALPLAVATLLVAPSAAATDCLPDPGYVPRREPLEVIAPALLFGWTFDRSAASFIGFELSYAHRYHATFGGYAQALLLSDPDAGGRRGQLGLGVLGGPWKSPLEDACGGSPVFAAIPPVARLGYAWRAGNLEADATSFAQLGVSANAILGAIFSFALPLQGGRSHGMQPSLALSLSLPVVVGRGGY